MGKLIFNAQSTPVAPVGENKHTMFVDNADGKLKMEDSGGCVCEIQSTSFTNNMHYYLYGTGCDGCLHLTVDCACSLDTSHNVFLCAKEYNFTDLIIDDGVTVRFCGDGIPIIKVQNCFCNNGIINTRTGIISNNSCGIMFLGNIITINNLANIGTLYTCSGGAQSSEAGWRGIYGGKGGDYGQAGSTSGSCSYYCPHNGGAACCCNGGGGGGQNYYNQTGTDGCPATEFNGGNGGTGSGGAGGGGGRGICCGGNGGAGSKGGNGGNGYYGKGGDGGGEAYGGDYGNGKGGDSMFCTGGTGGSGCTWAGNGGCSYYGNGGTGGNACIGGEGGHSYAGNGGAGGLSWCCSGHNKGGNSVGGAYGLVIFAKKIYNNCIHAAGGCGGAAGTGGSGSASCGCGTSGGNVAIMYDEGTLGNINVSKGAGANSASLKDGDLSIQKNIFI